MKTAPLTTSTAKRVSYSKRRAAVNPSHSRTEYKTRPTWCACPCTSASRWCRCVRSSRAMRSRHLCRHRRRDRWRHQDDGRRRGRRQVQQHGERNRASGGHQVSQCWSKRSRSSGHHKHWMCQIWWNRKIYRCDTKFPKKVLKGTNSRSSFQRQITKLALTELAVWLVLQLPFWRPTWTFCWYIASDTWPYFWTHSTTEWRFIRTWGPHGGWSSCELVTLQTVSCTVFTHV